MVKILVVGQTPPPFGGQAIMIQQLLETKIAQIEFHYVPMQFSKEMNQIGTFAISKVFELFKVILRILRYRIFEKARILYYPPAGPNKVPVLRDIVILGATRGLFDKTIFHFHAGGVSELYRTFPPALKFLFRKAYFYPDIAIRTSHLTPDDGRNLRARMEFVIPNGIEDEAKPYLNLITATSRNDHKPINLLYAGLLSESKGLKVLLNACRILANKHLCFHLNCLGVFTSELFEKQIKQFLDENHFHEKVTFHGEVSGTQKWEAFSIADIFCFPSHFESETFGLAILEAMSFSLPVIATKWRGIPTLVRDEVSGFLIPVEDSEALANKIERLMHEPGLRYELGKNGREIFLNNYSIQKHRDKLEEMFRSIT